MKGLRTKLSKFQASSSASDADVFCITESWPHPAILDGEIIDKSYSIFRKDRSYLTSNCARGGGVFIAIKQHICAELIVIPDNYLEQIYIKIKCNNVDLIIGCIYLPPQSAYEAYKLHCQQLSYLRNKYRNARLIIVGDYNLPSSTPRNDCDNLLYTGLASIGCTQRNNVPNEHHGLLDLCFSSVEINIGSTESVVSTDKYHPTLEITMELTPELKAAQSSSPALKKADYENLNAFFLTTDWTELHAHDSLEVKMKYFYDTVQDGISRYVPAHINKSNNFPCWFSNELIHKIKLKKAAHSTLKKKETSQNYKKFSDFRRLCKDLSTSCYKNYVNKVEQLVLSDSKELWKFIRNKKRSNNSEIPTNLVWNNRLANTGDEASNLFAAFFESVYPTMTQLPRPIQDINQHIQDNHRTLNDLEITVDNVKKTLLSLNSKKGAGPDGIPNIFLKNCATGLSGTTCAYF